MSADESSNVLQQADKELKGGNVQQAVYHYEEALELSRAQGNVQRQGAICIQLGQAYGLVDDWVKAAAYYEEATELAHALGPEYIGYTLQAQHQTAYAYRALALATPAGSDQVEAFDKARQISQAMLALAQKVGISLLERLAWASLGQAEQGLGLYEEAIASTSKAREMAFEDNDVISVANYTADLGDIKLLAGFIQEAQQEYKNGLSSLSTSDRHPYTALRLHDGLAETYLAQRQLDIAQSHADEALKLVQRARSRVEEALKLAWEAQETPLEARCHSTLGRIKTRLGRYEEAAAQHQEAIKLLQTRPVNRTYLDLAGEWGNLATNYRMISRYQAAIEALGQALETAQQKGDWFAEGKWQDTLGTVYQELGNWEEAEQCHLRALELLQQHDGNEIVRIQNNLGTLYYRRDLHEGTRNDFHEAANYYGEAEKGAEKAGDSLTIANVTGNLGIIFLHQEHYEKAIESFNEACKTLQEAGYGLEEGHQLENLGLAYGQYLRQPEKALDYYDKALEIARHYNDIDTQRVALTRKGDIYREHYGDFQKAEKLYREAITLIESEQKGRASLALGPHRAGLLARNLAAYEGLIRVHWQNSDWGQAFDYAEQARARVLTEQISLSTSLPEEGLASDLLHKERELIHRARQYEHRFINAQDIVERASLAEERRKIQQKLNKVWEELADSPQGQQYVRSRYGAPGTVESLQQWVNDRPNTAVIAYYTWPETIYVWVFRAGEPIQTERIPISRKQLSGYRDLFEWDISGYQRFGIANTFWRDKLAPLITRIYDHLQRAEKIVFIPHGHLHRIPLHALPVAGKVVAEEFAVTYTPNARLLIRPVAKAVQSTASATRALVMGYTDREKEIATFTQAIEQAATIFGIKPHFGREASYDRLRQEAAEADLIYILCHGQFNTQNPLDSCLSLEGKELTGRQIMDLNLSGALVILMACEAGMSQVTSGDESSGLSHAFLMAGATAVLSARWPVEAQLSIKLVEDFYTNWHDNNVPLDIALQQAINNIRRNQSEGNLQYNHPFYWAPFALMGNIV